MIVELTKTFGFESAHCLPNLPDGHKCRRLHGHSFRFDITVRGEVDERTGLFLDYGDISSAVRPLVEALDHRYLNEIDGLENPSSEHLARWIWRRLISELPSLHQVVVRETCTNACTFRGEGL